MIDESAHAQLKALADANERTIQAQARVLLMSALEEELQPDPPVRRARSKGAAA